MLFVTVPHSGEVIPEDAKWLLKIDALTLLTDVDRFVHELYGPVCREHGIPMVVAPYHRYAVDLNRTPEDVDPTLVEGLPEGRAALAKTFVSGFHWARTTKGAPLLPAPISLATHQALIKNVYDPFHAEVKRVEREVVAKNGLPRFHLDLHSMPSQGTSAHKDNGAKRPDIVVSDCEGKSAQFEFVEMVKAAFSHQGFNVAYNWPYKGGRMTETYGVPSEQRHSVQIELNRALYMDEVTKERNPQFESTRKRLGEALLEIYTNLK